MAIEEVYPPDVEPIPDEHRLKVELCDLVDRWEGSGLDEERLLYGVLDWAEYWTNQLAMTGSTWIKSKEKETNMALDEEYKDRFPEEIVGLREQVEEKIREYRKEAAEISKIESIYAELDMEGAVSIKERGRGELILTAWATNIDNEQIKTLIRDFDGDLSWDYEEGLWVVRAQVWRY